MPSPRRGAGPCRSGQLRGSAPAEVYAALWLGALIAATGAAIDPFPPQIEELARRYFEAFPPEVKA